MEIRRLTPQDAETLARFYNGLSEESKRTFRPLGPKTTPEICREVARANRPEADEKFDLIALAEGEIIGWCFLWDLKSPEPTFGLAVADAYQGKGLGSTLMDRVMAEARARGLATVILTVVTDNERAWRLYQKRGFVRYGTFLGDDGLWYYRMRARLSPEGSDRSEEEHGSARES